MDVRLFLNQLRTTVEKVPFDRGTYLFKPMVRGKISKKKKTERAAWSMSTSSTSMTSTGMRRKVGSFHAKAVKVGRAKKIDLAEILHKCKGVCDWLKYKILDLRDK